MSKLKDENYYQVSGWMINRLELKGVELQVFAIIYGFSQDGESKFTGSINYLCDWTGVSRPTIIKALKDLTDKEFLIKETEVITGVTFNHYRINFPYVTNFTGSKETLLGGSKETLHYNNTIDNNTLSKDNVLDTGSTQNPPKPAQSSGRLFSSARNTGKNSPQQRTNRFITACQREAVKKSFSPQVLRVLDEYFIMLGEMNCLLPSRSIAEQLSWLQRVSPDKQIAVIRGTISHGWKSLQYEAEANINSAVPSWDTAAPDAFQAKTEEEKSKDWRQEVPDDRIF